MHLRLARERQGLVVIRVFRVAMLFGLTAALTEMTPPTAVQAAPLGPGCAADRRAVAHHPGGVAIDPQPPGGPIPCGVLTGFGSSETHVVVDGAGNVFYNPAITKSATGLAISRDDGATWSLSPGGGSIDNSLYADPDTTRVFWIPYNLQSAQEDVRSSDDGGRTWRSAVACCGGAENARFTTAAPRVSQTHGYPKIVYLCANTSLAGGAESAAGARVCSRSADGGATFTLIGTLFSKPVPQHTECLPFGDQFGPTDGHYPQGGPNGTLYLVVRCGPPGPEPTDTEYLERSDDEGATWRVLHQVPLSTAPSLDIDELRVDTGGNLYLVRTDPATFHPLMRVSTNEGGTWSPEMDIGPPGVEIATQANSLAHVFINPHLWEVAVREPGRAAVGYYGRPKGQTRWDGYLTETWNALDPQPVLWSARLNPTTVDLTDGVTLPSGGNDFMGAAFAPDGTPWASFNHSTGFAGRLLRVATGGASTPPRTGARTRHRGELPATGGRVWPFLGVGAMAAAVAVRRWSRRARS